MQRAHAIANGIHVAAVNRVGEEGELEFWGGSFVCDSFGKVLNEASTTKEEVLVANVGFGQEQENSGRLGFSAQPTPRHIQAAHQRQQERCRR